MTDGAIADLKRLAGLEPYRRYLNLKPGPSDTLLAVCPWHDDHKPSLTVYRNASHHCFACGANGDALDLIQQLDGCDLRAARERLEEIVGVSAPKMPVGPGELKAIYRYVDEQDELLFEVLRYERPDGKKEFRQRRPGPDGMIWGLDGVRRVLYRLPKVLEADEVFVVEGEKDVATLEKLGCTATSCAGGASAKWLPEYTEALRGKTVYVVPDQDAPGLKHGEKILAAVPWAKMIRLPVKDVTDFVAQGAGLVEIKARIAKPWFQNIQALHEIKAPPVSWLIEPIIPDGGVVMLSGNPGSFKSFLALDIASSVARGGSFAGRRRSAARPVLYLDAENPLSVIGARRRFLGISPCEQLRYWPRSSGAPLPELDDTNLLAFAAERPLIVLDSFIRFHKGSENDNAEVAGTMAKILNLAAKGATVILLHHAGKDPDKQFRGATELEAAPDVCFRAKREGEVNVKLVGYKNRFTQERSHRLKLEEGGFLWLAEE